MCFRKTLRKVKVLPMRVINGALQPVDVFRGRGFLYRSLAIISVSLAFAAHGSAQLLVFQTSLSVNGNALGVGPTVIDNEIRRGHDSRTAGFPCCHCNPQRPKPSQKISPLGCYLKLFPNQTQIKQKFNRASKQAEVARQFPKKPSELLKILSV